MDAELIQTIATKAARWHCPKEYLREDAASSAILKMLERLPGYDPERSKLSTFLWAQARYGISDFLRGEFGRKDQGRGKVVCYSIDWEDDNIDALLVPADTALDIARRLDNIDLTATPTVSQWRGNLPTVETLRRRS